MFYFRLVDLSIGRSIGKIRWEIFLKDLSWTQVWLDVVLLNFGRSVQSRTSNKFCSPFPHLYGDTTYVDVSQTHQMKNIIWCLFTYLLISTVLSVSWLMTAYVVLICWFFHFSSFIFLLMSVWSVNDSCWFFLRIWPVYIMLAGVFYFLKNVSRWKVREIFSVNWQSDFVTDYFNCFKIYLALVNYIVKKL